jgi:hypothetical protein
MAHLGTYSFSGPPDPSWSPPQGDPYWKGRAAFRARSEEADDGDRTRDPQLGKLMLYQLSYVRARPILAH